MILAEFTEDATIQDLNEVYEQHKEIIKGFQLRGEIKCLNKIQETMK